MTDTVTPRSAYAYRLNHVTLLNRHHDQAYGTLTALVEDTDDQPPPEPGCAPRMATVRVQIADCSNRGMALVGDSADPQAVRALRMLATAVGAIGDGYQTKSVALPGCEAESVLRRLTGTSQLKLDVDTGRGRRVRVAWDPPSAGGSRRSQITLYSGSDETRLDLLGDDNATWKCDALRAALEDAADALHAEQTLYLERLRASVDAFAALPKAVRDARRSEDDIPF